MLAHFQKQRNSSVALEHTLQCKRATGIRVVIATLKKYQKDAHAITSQT